MEHKSYRPFPKPPPDVARLEEEVLPGSRTELYHKAIVAVDCARGEAEHRGEEHFDRYCWEELFPFLEAERAKAAEEEGLTPYLRWEKSLFARL